MLPSFLMFCFQFVLLNSSLVFNWYMNSCKLRLHRVQLRYDSTIVFTQFYGEGITVTRVHSCSHARFN